MAQAAAAGFPGTAKGTRSFAKAAVEPVGLCHDGTRSGEIRSLGPPRRPLERRTAGVGGVRPRVLAIVSGVESRLRLPLVAQRQAAFAITGGWPAARFLDSRGSERLGRGAGC